MPGRLLLLALLALILVAPPGARAAAGEVRVAAPWESDGDIREDYSYRVQQLRYVGAPGRASNLTVRFGKAGRATLSDPGGVRAGRGCRQAGADRVRCRVRGRKPVENAGARFILGQGDDVLRLRGIPRTGTAWIAGGAGDDRIQGSAGADEIFPGRGDDQVVAGGGADWIGADGGADDLAGGPGLDELSYSGRSDTVHVDADGDADDGEPGEGDRARPDLEQLTGGYGSDELVGNERRNVLDGGSAGADVLVGGDGDDYLRVHGAGSRLEGGGGDDLLWSNEPAAFDAGAGHDRVEAGTEDSTVAVDDGEADEVHCGNAVGTAAAADALDLVLGCGSIARSGGAATPRFWFGYDFPYTSDPLRTYVWRGIAIYDHRLIATVGCSSDMPAPCTVRVVLRHADGTVFDLEKTIAPGAQAEFSRRVPRRERKLVRARRYTLRLEGTDAAGAPVTLEERDLRAESTYLG